MKTTPIYVVAYRMENISGNNIFLDSNHNKPQHFNRESAIARAKELEVAGYRVSAYHYGFKERGFNPNEPHCTVVHQSPTWND